MMKILGVLLIAIAVLALGTGSVDGAIMFGIIGYVLFRIGNRGKGNGFKGSAAEKYLNESREYYRKDTERHLERQRQKEQLLQEANRLEQQARYGSDYERRRLMNEAKELRRQAGRL